MTLVFAILKLTPLRRPKSIKRIIELIHLNTKLNIVVNKMSLLTNEKIVTGRKKVGAFTSLQIWDIIMLSTIIVKLKVSPLII